MLKRTGAAMVKGASSKYKPWQLLPQDFFANADDFRDQLSQTYGGDANCFAVIPSSSYGLSTAARILEDHVESNQEILVLDEAFPSNFLPWHRLAEITGAKLVVVPTPDDFNWTKSVLDRVNKKTAVVAIPNCHWTNGALLDVATISDAAREVGAVLAMDITQSLGALPFDFDRVKPDFAVASGYKWSLFPYGLSIFYADPKWHGARPLEETWLNREGAEVFEDLVNYNYNYQPGARRFDMGQKCISSVMPGGLEALRQIGEWGVANISETLKATNDIIAETCEAIGLTPIPEEYRSPHLLGVTSEHPLSPNMTNSFAKQGIYFSRRGSSLRFAPHLHISDNDIDRLTDSLRTEFRAFSIAS